MLGPYICKHEAREEVGGQNPETKPLWLGSRPAVSNGEGVWCRMVVVHIARSGGGRGHRVHKHEWEEGPERDLGLKAQNRVQGLGFGVHLCN